MVLVPHFQNVDETSHEARLSPGSCTVDNQQLQLSTFRVQSCSAWPKPILLSFTTPATPVREGLYNVKGQFVLKCDLHSLGLYIHNIYITRQLPNLLG